MLKVSKYPMQEAFERDPLGATITYYASCLVTNPKAIAAVERLLGLSLDSALEACIGFGDRSLGNQLPTKQVTAGRRLRTRLEELGIYKANGRESLRGYITIPVKDADGSWTGINAIRIDAKTGDACRLLVGFETAKDVSIEGTKVEIGQTTSDEIPTTRPPSIATIAHIAAHPRCSSQDHELEVAPEHVVLARGDRTYRIRGLDTNMSSLSLRVSIQASRQDAVYLDSLDLMRSAARAAFVKAAAVELYCAEETVKKDLGTVLLHLDDFRNRQIEAAKAKRPVYRELTPEETSQAMSLLRAPNLVDRIVGDLEQCGVVGESFNKLAAYLAVVSRKLPSPLSILIQSSSSAGKTTLMDTILAMVPPEDVLRLSNLTGRALYYLDRDALCHKTLAISEDHGMADAAYALKLLQSEGKLSHASVAKASDGRTVTQFHRVDGPVQLFLTSTSQDIDEELLSRCLLLAVDESKEQTRAIQQRQRMLHSRHGLEKQSVVPSLQSQHRNAQRLLRPLVVTNDFETTTDFPYHRTRHRRDHAKYLTLIDAIALLHQYQRTIVIDDAGKESISVEASDIELANCLMDKLLRQSNNDLPPQSQRCVEMLQGYVLKQCDLQKLSQVEFRFTRREFREESGWTDNQLRVHFDRLIALEILRVHRGKQGCAYVYELLN